MKILITGAKGQLGLTLKDVLSDHDLILTDKDELDITNANAVDKFVADKKPDIIINAAGYTAVDKAETDKELARNINVDGAKNLAKASKNVNALFFHISTDFVFDGQKKTPYIESDQPRPLSIYGQTKFESELAVQKIGGRYYILRTAWLYSPYGKNFVKTMIKLAQEKDELNVVNDQIGSPTYTYDLAQVVKFIILNTEKDQCKSVKEISGGAIPFDLYHFSGEGETSWYGFAKEIFERTNTKIKLTPITSAEYPSKAKRPSYSYLSKDKIKSFGIKVRPWQESLKKCIDVLKSETYQADL